MFSTVGSSILSKKLLVCGAELFGLRRSVIFPQHSVYCGSSFLFAALRFSFAALRFLVCGVPFFCFRCVAFRLRRPIYFCLLAALRCFHLRRCVFPRRTVLVLPVIRFPFAALRCLLAVLSFFLFESPNLFCVTRFFLFAASGCFVRRSDFFAALHFCLRRSDFCYHGA